MLPIISRFKKNKEPEDLLFIDLGTHQVKTAALKLPMQLEANPKILGTHIRSVGTNSLRGRQVHNLDDLLEAISDTIDHVSIAAGQQPPQAIIGLSGGSVQYAGLNTRLHRPEPDLEIDQTELNEILSRIEDETEDNARKKIDLSDVKEWEHLGVIITDYLLDGALVKTPVGLQGAVLEAKVLHGFWEPTTQKLVDTISSQLGTEIIMVWETAVVRALRAREQRESFVLVDIGGQTTELVLVRGRRLVKNQSFNLGSDHWTYRLGQELGMNNASAEKLKHAFHEEVLDQVRMNKAREILEEEIGNYIYGLAAALAGLQDGRSLPSRMVFSGNGSTLNLVKSKVVAFPWKQENIFDSFPQVEKLTEEYLNQDLYYGYNLLS